MSILLHWLVALAVFGLFALGLWMTGLDYYHPWYKQGPDIHRAVGILLLLVIGLRITWRTLNPAPAALPGHRRWELMLAGAAHALLLLLPLLLIVSGYLISTADGRSVSVFGWFEVPALLAGFDQQEEIMGNIHAFLAWCLVGVAALHALGALKHHFIDRDITLTRMLGVSTPQKEEHHEA